LSDVFTTYRKTVEPLRDHPRPVLPALPENSLPPYPDPGSIPAQHDPFVIPDSLEGLEASLLKPLTPDSISSDPPSLPPGTESAHPFHGGESKALERLEHLIASGSANAYHDTRNGLLGVDFSTKLSAYLVQGCITARQIHDALLRFEDGTNPNWTSVTGYGQGENKGTENIRFELLWRDYMRLCTRKFGSKLFLVSGFKDKYEAEWSNPSHPLNGLTSDQVKNQIERFVNGTTGMGLIDASLREMYHTGYTSNRARQNVASFLAKHLKIDWRIGAEWYECMLVDYDLSSNWGNWQYLAGVGNDPREGREFNPVKQAFDYDGNADYVKAWVPELRGLTEPSEAFQAWTAPETRLEKLGLKDLIWVKEPLKKIPFTVNRRGRHQGRGRGGDRGDRGGRGRGGAGGEGGSSSQGQGRGGGPSSYQPSQNRGSYGGRGYGSTRGQFRGYGGGRGPRGGGRGDDNTGGRDLRTGMMEKDKNFQELAEAQYADE
jgi:deoxyribodipyrimidine photo-lyase